MVYKCVAKKLEEALTEFVATGIPVMRATEDCQIRPPGPHSVLSRVPMGVKKPQSQAGTKM